MPKNETKDKTVTTQEGTDLIVKPLTIRALRKFMAVMSDMDKHQREVDREQDRYERELKVYNQAVADGEEAEEPTQPDVDEFAMVDTMIEAAKIALEKHNPNFVADEDNLEDELDMDTLSEILEIAGGVKMGNPGTSAPQTPTKRA